MRPESITVHLFADGVEMTDKVATIAGETVDEDGNWTYTWTGLDKFKEGEEIEYTVKEDEIEGYETEITGDQDKGFTITNTHEIEKINVTVEKKWEDNNNQDGYRPGKITVHLLADGTELTDKKVEISEDKDGNWAYTWEDLDKYANGEEIVYTITEDEIDEYTTDIAGDYKEGFVITNTHTPEEVTVTVTKIWDDADDQDGKRPDSLTVDLYADGKKVDGKTQQLKGEDWTYTWTGLPKKADGKDIKYTVQETLPDGYSQAEGSPKVEVDEETGNTTVTITNTYTPEKTSVTVTKVWEDAGNQDGIRPDSITVKLLANGEEAGEAVLDEDNDWTYTWTGLDKFNEGEEIEYTVSEEPVEGYDEPVITGTQADGYTITNSHTPETVDVPVTKEWEDSDDQDGYRPDKITAILKADGEQIKTVELNEGNNWTYTWEGLPKYKAVGKEIVYTVDEQPVEHYDKKIEGNTIINTHVTEKTEVSVEKVWKDENNQDGVRPEKVTVNLLANGEKIDSVELSEENEWQYTWTKLDKKSGGKDIEYTVTEETVDKYTTEITGSQKDGYVVTNTHVPETIDIPVEKIWEDNEDNDGKRPKSVTVYLKADGETVKTVELNEGNEWKYTWTGMAKYKAGVEIKYTVEEKTVANYDEPVIEGSVEDGFKITNPREDDKTSVPVEKKWEGDANLGVRPESIEVELLADDKETGKTITLNEGNNWKGTFEDLVVNKDGKKVIYDIKEVDVKPGYQSTVSGNAEDGFVITNKFTPKYIDPPVLKKVIGDSDGSGDKFTFQLKALNGAPMPDGVTGDTMTLETGTGEAEFGIITIAKVGEYEYEISEVPDDGNENYQYDDTVYHLRFVITEGENGELVDEAFVDGVSVGTFEDIKASQFTFVNEYREYIDIDVEKVWKDESTGPDKRPDSIIVELLADGETIITVELSDENEWKHTFEHLEVSRKTDDGEYVPIEYTVNEVKVEAYETSISGSAEEGFVITNTRTVDTGDASQLDFWRNLYITSTVGSLLVAALYFKKEEEK